MEDVNVLIIYISGGKSPAIAGFWKDIHGKERSILEPVYKTSCFGTTVTDGDECMRALQRIETAFNNSTLKGGMKLAYWEILETAPEDRGALYTALKLSKIPVIPFYVYDEDKAESMMSAEIAMAIFPESRREICLAGTGYALMSARDCWKYRHTNEGDKDETV